MTAINKTKLINDIKREYDNDRLAAERLLKARRDEVYSKCPEIMEIDEHLALFAIDLSKAILSGKTDGVEKMAAEHDKKQARRMKLLDKYGFKADYLEDVHKCRTCLDTGHIDGGGKCHCYKQKLIAKYYKLSNLSTAFEKENFDNFDMKYYSTAKDRNTGVSPREKMELIYGRVMSFLDDFDHEPANLFFHGQVGVGKTYMCNAIAKEILERGHTVLYAPATKLFKTIEDARFNRDDMSAPSDVIDFFYTAELLIIDDLGTEVSTIVTRSALFDIINSRVLDGRSTIISSNFTLKELAENYLDRIGSRLLEHYTVCHFIGEDIRQAKKYAYSSSKA